MRFGLLILLWVSIACFPSCTDSALVDTNRAIPNHNWSYANKVSVNVTITDPSVPYNVYLNFRHTADYRYSNIFVVMHQSGPGVSRTSERMEFRIAYPDGEWLGSGSGSLYSYQFPVRERYKFPAKGTYSFEFEQNMRDNPLREVSDVGLRVAPADR